MAKLIFKDIAKSFDEHLALSDIQAVIEDGEFVALLGPSGCGKTTLLRILAGFETPTKGELWIGNRCVAAAHDGSLTPPEDRNIGIVFQSYALWPHMTVRQNIAYPLGARKRPKQAREKRIAAVLADTELGKFAERMPAELSGGQRQRVALARCLVSDPQAVLLDEPLANLDVGLRAAMLDVFSDFHQRTKATMVYVTHDQSEAMAMADRIAVMSDGRIVQFDKPERLYNQPKNRFVAQFVGTGAVLPIEGLTKHHEGWGQAQIFGKSIAVMFDDPHANEICVRPENLTLGESGDFQAQVTRLNYLGGMFRVTLTLPSGHNIFANSVKRMMLGEKVGITLGQCWAYQD